MKNKTITEIKRCNGRDIPQFPTYTIAIVEVERKEELCRFYGVYNTENKVIEQECSVLPKAIRVAMDYQAALDVMVDPEFVAEESRQARKTYSEALADLEPEGGEYVN
ncbi:MAG: hypothetical protein KAI07_04535 [Deltaproteobacteria bacterium]|nr:hypothetical protein [Deltaproteobacteria bacterium]